MVYPFLTDEIFDVTHPRAPPGGGHPDRFTIEYRKPNDPLGVLTFRLSSTHVGTHVGTHVAPEPATVLLTAAGLAGIVCARGSGGPGGRGERRRGRGRPTRAPV